MHRPLLLLFALLLPAVAAAQTNNSYHTTLFGKFNPAPNAGAYSGLTGYVAPNGREYALLGGFTGTHIIDVTEAPIKQVAFIEGPASGWREMKTYGSYGYVVSEGGDGLQIIDLSKLPASATLVKSDETFFRSAHTISQQGTFLYINGTNSEAGANGGTIILDLKTNPTSPTLVGQWDGRYVHDATIRNDTLYAAAINDGRLDIIYLGADRKNPRFVADIRYPGAGTHNADLSVDGRYIMTTDEVGTTPKTLKVWDRSDIENITKVADFTPAPGEIIHNVHTKGRLAVISWYTAGTRIIDITDPRDPVEVGFYDNHAGSPGGFAGNWETYPYLPSGKIISSDMQGGLYVFTFDGAQRGSVSGTVTDASTGAPLVGATISLPSLGKTIVTDANGRYRITGATDTLSFTAAAFNYRASNGSVVLKTAGNTVDIKLEALALSTFAIHVFDSASGMKLHGFAYRLFERAEDGIAGEEGKSLQLPTDSVYTIRVGAWGYRAKNVTLSQAGGTEVSVHLAKGYEDDVELDLGWALSDTYDDAPRGLWERGVPVRTRGNGATVQPEEDHTPGFGEYAFITQITGTQSNVPGSSDVDSGAVSLTSPRFDLANSIDPTIHVSLWYSRDKFPDDASTNDTLLVLISNDDGESWKTLERITASPEYWTEHAYRVKSFVPVTDRMLFRVVAADNNEQSWIEAGVDDFSITDLEPASAVRDIATRGASAIVTPNPIASRGVLTLDVASHQGRALVEIFDNLGRHVVTLHDGMLERGTHTLAFDMSAQPAGAYRWRLRLEDGSVTTGEIVVVR